MQKYFKILVLKLNASMDEVKRAYKQQAKRGRPRKEKSEEDQSDT